jgi:tetratricopeptide (TPR) repeat protein
MSAGGMSSFERLLSTCELHAVLAGYTSSSVYLYGRHALDDPDVGTITLHRPAGVVGDSISVTSLAAPSKAKKEYEKGREALTKNKLSDAETHFRRAVTEYPKYAVAWQLLGEVEEREKRLDSAQQDFLQAIAADAKYVPPHIALAFLSASQNKWAETLQLCDEALRLDPVDYYLPYYLQATADFNLHQIDAAETSANKAAAIDRDHRQPRILLLQGTIAQAKRDFVAASSHFREYLKLVPNDPNAEAIKANIDKMEQLSAAATKPAVAPPHR